MNCSDVEGTGSGLIQSLTIDMANQGKPQPTRGTDEPRPEQDLYRIQGRRHVDTATRSLIFTVTSTTQVQRPLIVVRHQTSEKTPL